MGNSYIDDPHCSLETLNIPSVFNIIFVPSHMQLEATRVNVGSMNMGFVSDTARTRTRTGNLFH